MSDFERSHFRQPLLRMLCQVLDEAWRELEPQVRGKQLTREEVAQRIMQSALLGERNPARLKADAMKADVGKRPDYIPREVTSLARPTTPT